MQYLQDYDVARVLFFSRGTGITNGSGAVIANPPTNTVYGSSVALPASDAARGYFEFSIPQDLARMYEKGRALVSVTNVWSGEFEDPNVNWDVEQIALYSNLPQQYGFDARSFNQPMKIWAGNAFRVGGGGGGGGTSRFYINSSGQTTNSPFLNGHTIQSVGPIPNVIKFQFSSIETAMNSAFHPVSFTRTSGGVTYTLSVAIELTFVVPRISATSTVKTIV